MGFFSDQTITSTFIIGYSSDFLYSFFLKMQTISRGITNGIYKNPLQEHINLISLCLLCHQPFNSVIFFFICRRIGMILKRIPAQFNLFFFLTLRFCYIYGFNQTLFPLRITDNLIKFEKITFTTVVRLHNFLFANLRI